MNQNRVAMIVVSSLLTLTIPTLATGKENTQSTSAQTTHQHAHETQNTVYQGYFEDGQIKERPLSDWEGEWQSVYPYLMDGTLDPVLVHKAESGEKSLAEYRSYYETGYKTDVVRVIIAGDEVSFVRDSGIDQASYASDGYEILTYKKGNRGVRFIFKKMSGSEKAPDFIQFSDHIIAPQKSEHYHLYWGNDRSAVLRELTNWPTYYPADLSAKQIVDEMLAH